MSESVVTILEHAAELEGLRGILQQYEDRGKRSLPASFYDDVNQIRADAVAAQDQNLAKAVWCIESIAKAQDAFTEGFWFCKEDKFYSGWRRFERCENVVAALRKHYSGGGQRFGVDQIVEHLPRFQALFPYRVFLSPGYIVGKATCSICNSLLGLRSGCDHEVGEIYDGKMCVRVVSDLKALEVSFVKNPVQKYSVVFPEGISYNYGAVHYVVQGLRSPWHCWSFTKLKVDSGTPLYSGIGRNDSCPCGSGVEYQDCCIEKTQKREHYQFLFEVPPPDDLPKYVEEGAYYVPDDEGPALSRD